jgi:hypothetical protein
VSTLIFLQPLLGVEHEVEDVIPDTKDSVISVIGQKAWSVVNKASNSYDEGFAPFGKERSGGDVVEITTAVVHITVTVMSIS